MGTRWSFARGRIRGGRGRLVCFGSLGERDCGGRAADRGVAGLAAYDAAAADAERLKGLAGKLNAPVGEIEKKLEALLGRQKQMEKELEAARHAQAGGVAKELLRKPRIILNGTPVIVENVGALSGDQIQGIMDALKGEFAGVIVLAGVSEGQVALAAAVSREYVGKYQAGKIIQQIAPVGAGRAVGGRIMRGARDGMWRRWERRWRRR